VIELPLTQSNQNQTKIKPDQTKSDQIKPEAPFLMWIAEEKWDRFKPETGVTPKRANMEGMGRANNLTKSHPAQRPDQSTWLASSCSSVLRGTRRN